LNSLSIYSSTQTVTTMQVSVLQHHLAQRNWFFKLYKMRQKLNEKLPIAI